VNFAPIVFVALWSTGFVGAKYGLPYADPFIFLSIRVAIAAGLLAIYAIATKQSLRLNRADIKVSAYVGATLHFAYLGGVFYAISEGMPAGISATVTSLQPILVSLIAVKILGEKLSARQYLGLVFGFIGVVLVLSPAFAKHPTLKWSEVIAMACALAGSTGATLIQKKSGGKTPLVPGTIYQYVFASILFLAAACVTRGFHIEWSGKFIFAISWLVLALSVGAILILLTLLKHGSASQVSSLLYLVPPATALESYILFHEKLTRIDLLGIALTAIGVYLVIRKTSIRRSV